jgi:hypothetical protein
VYGDPLEHPQKETYWGNVNPIGERSCYDEGKRAAECLTFDYLREHNLEVRGFPRFYRMPLFVRKWKRAEFQVQQGVGASIWVPCGQMEAGGMIRSNRMPLRPCSKACAQMGVGRSHDLTECRCFHSYAIWARWKRAYAAVCCHLGPSYITHF